MTIDELREKRAQEQFGRPYLELSEFYRGRVDDYIRIEESQRRAVDPVGEKSGVTQKQLDYIVAKIAESFAAALEKMLPSMVHSQVTKALPTLVQPLIATAIATSEANTAAAVQAAIGAAETAAGAITRAGSGGDSHRVERLSEHISRIETRVQKLERQ